MELMQEKYIQTEIGLIPEDWKIIKLEENVTLKARIGWQGLTTAEYLNSGDYCLVTGTDFLNGYVDWDNCVFVEKERFDQDKNIQLKVEDVLVTKDGTIGKVAYVDKISKLTTLNSGVFVLRPKSPKIHNRFLYYVLMSFYFDDFLNKITAGSTITHLYQKDFVHFNFILPPIEEQTAIATALSDSDNWINSLEQLIAKKRLIKQGAMQELLQPKEGWEVKKLGELGKLYGGLSGKTKSDFNKGEFPYIPFMNVMSNPVIKTTYFDYVNIKPGESQNQALKGDLFFNGSSETPEEVGMCSVLMEDVPNLYLNSFCFGYRLYKELDNDCLYLSYFFRSTEGRKLFYSMAQGATRYNLSKGNFVKLEIALPKKEEQTHIATILSDMDAEITALEGKLEKAKQLKLGMMQELLTGRIRLVSSISKKMKLKKIFEDITNEFQSDQVIIKETSLDEIQKIRPGFINGCFFPYVLNNEYEHFEILIDKELDYDKKICIILHEMGHVELNNKLGYQEVDKRIKDDRPKWTQFTEFHAYKHQLAEGKKLFEKGHRSILEKIIKSINETYLSTDIILPYKLAIEDIFKDPIWKECKHLIEKK